MSAGTRILSEYESKRLLREYGVPTVEERLATDSAEAVERAGELGFPVALKLCAEGLAHKTERGLVRLDLADGTAVRAAGEQLLAARRPEDGGAALLVQRMVRGRRELIAGLTRDPQFGPCVMFGLGGVFAEAFHDVVFRVAPLAREDAEEMVEGLRTARVLEAFRGDPAVDRETLVALLVGVGRLGMERPEVVSIDVNPLIVQSATPVAVDALVEIEGTS